MAGDEWIKMRGSLLEHPKLIAIARMLQANRAFRDWLTPGGGGEMNGQLVSTPALRAVTSAALLRAWSTSRAHGQFHGDDLHLPNSEIVDLDEMAGVPGLGEAMESVGWAVENPDGEGIILPRFKEFNVPKTGAERQREHRERRNEGVTKTSRKSNAGSVTNSLPEKRREEGSIYPPVETLEAGNSKPPTGSHRKEAQSVLAFLNDRAGKAFQPTDANLDLIVARLKEGYTAGQCRQVIVRKVREWGPDEKMAPYLRPATLFNREKFNQYAGELVGERAPTSEGELFP